MPFPETTRLELPILQELQATGGSDQVRYLYDRLTGYFPQLSEDDLAARTETGRNRWRTLVQRAGKQLADAGELKRAQAHWTITPRGLKRVAAEAVQFEPSRAPGQNATRALSHREAQDLLVEIGSLLGWHAEAEFEYYDVVWRASAHAPRLSHVFEVQIAGSVDSALTRLKQAYEAQRSQLFLVIGAERDVTFARKRLAASFHEILHAVTVIGVGDLQRLAETLQQQAVLLEKLVRRV
ncbi:MAG: winged helix-turn-helix domain-containing protein [Acidobacteria bacterium]|nr:winged helix-turn-helix domain-containing protein [Acidobacteriota bacterium]MBI3423916.1 winged helix-turn-helix domain-containing protein [Acidobacteriota bacterium]